MKTKKIYLPCESSDLKIILDDKIINVKEKDMYIFTKEELLIYTKSVLRSNFRPQTVNKAELLIDEL